jgi:hypothetical protein
VATFGRGTPYTWDARAERYRDRFGRFVARREIRSALDATLVNTAKRMRANALSLRDGSMSLDAWAAEMRASIKDVHLYSTAVARGGWDQMTFADFGRVGRLVRDQYAYLDRFVADVEAGLALDGRFLTRVNMYQETGRRTYYDAIARQLEDRGFDQARSVLHPADHCGECIAQAAMGWQPIDEFVPIGERECLSNCRCHAEYRNSSTGEVWTDYAG